ncbi:MAG: hypothetical protein JSS02_30220 [Planctomycetes bacterium]|nr:hypothetical protein [Planctomycetota bacterium]
MGILGTVSAWKGLKIYRRHVAYVRISQLEPTEWADYDHLFDDPPWYADWLPDDWSAPPDYVVGFDFSSVPEFNQADFGAFSDRLTSLSLSSTRVTDAGMADLLDLVRLEWLEIGNTEIGDPGLSNLRRMSKLEHLDLHGTRLTDAGLAHLAALTNLRFLNLSRTRVSDAGMVRLKALTRLETLRLDGTQLTDAGLAQLESLATLRDLSVEQTNVTVRGVAKFNWICPQHPIRKYIPEAMREPGDPFGVLTPPVSPRNE